MDHRVNNQSKSGQKYVVYHSYDCKSYLLMTTYYSWIIFLLPIILKIYASIIRQGLIAGLQFASFVTSRHFETDCSKTFTLCYPEYKSHLLLSTYEGQTCSECMYCECMYCVYSETFHGYFNQNLWLSVAYLLSQHLALKKCKICRILKWDSLEW